MSVLFDPWTVHPSDHLREFVERWRDEPAEAMACASTAGMTVERAKELLDGTPDWTLIEAADIGFIFGPSAAFWQRLLKNYRDAVAQGKKVVE